MKFYVTMKTPDALSDAIKEAATQEVLSQSGSEEEDNYNIESLSEEIQELCTKWFKYDEYLTVEIDTVEKTCVVR
jgi:hypothetical protein